AETGSRAESHMQLVKFLKNDWPPITWLPRIAFEVEYRLACSGQLYNRRVLTADWTKEPAARVLLRKPVELFVASQPFDDYPQELCARLKVYYVEETRRPTNSESGVPVTQSKLSIPGDEIIEDLCAILTLLSRRLISVVGKIRERRSESESIEPG